jgi:hypothetical protein
MGVLTMEIDFGIIETDETFFDPNSGMMFKKINPSEAVCIESGDVGEIDSFGLNEKVIV